ncbi:Serine threonine- kinase CTR1 [Chlorella sorokiniana]|uniref:Serine threonine-kinase CTR1 n=1 Tax=Chlorella sorokiniana TaxID=3076 RepID=A0A2P6TY91_CHLSO|nr:Serine threonine- kinase CTR1 [Chlorella sorokiniana]|eukprot:PRW59026.1 Serine threonine- kinase CTR1 [Chlorella sorokiniana]
MGGCLSSESASAAANILQAAGDAGRLRELLNNDPDALNVADSEGRTALHLAAARGDCERLEVLIDAGADLNLKNSRGETAGEVAQLGGNRAAALLLLHASELACSQGAPEDYERIQDPLYPNSLYDTGGSSAADYGLNPMFGRREADEGATLEAMWSALTDAARHGKLTKLRHLLRLAERRGSLETAALLRKLTAGLTPVSAVRAEAQPEAPALPGARLDDSAMRKQPGSQTGDLTGSVGADTAAEDPGREVAAQAPTLGSHLCKWEIAFSELQVGDFLGSGSFGAVFKAQWQETAVACKLLGTTGVAVLSSQTVEELHKEATLLLSLRHPNCVTCYGLCTSTPAIVTEYCALGSLGDLLKRASSNPSVAKQLTWHRRLNIALGIAKGMHYLHSRQPPVIHRDLKSMNVLVNHEWRAKLLTWQQPYSGVNVHMPPEEELETYISLMKCCWAQDPQERPTFAAVLQQLRPLAEAEHKRVAAARARTGPPA